MNNKVRDVLESILDRFKSGDIPEAIKYSLFPIPDIPSAKWSFMNRLIMNFSNTADARGIKQWNKVGRTVKKGAKAIYILVPRMIKANTDNNEHNENEDNKEKLKEKLRVHGFLAQPVFRFEDTEGEPLAYQKELSLPDLPLMEKAKQWGISVSAIPNKYRAYGAYVPATQQILLATSEEIVFFHELSHAAYERAVEKLKPGQVWNQEITAELSAQVLTRLVGKQPQDKLGNSYRYIEHYAKDAGLSALSACLNVLNSVEKVLSLILSNEENDGNADIADVDIEVDSYKSRPTETMIIDAAAQRGGI
jgi:hypothetical protein